MCQSCALLLAIQVSAAMLRALCAGVARLRFQGLRVCLTNPQINKLSNKLWVTTVKSYVGGKTMHRGSKYLLGVFLLAIFSLSSGRVLYGQGGATGAISSQVV